MRIGIIAPPFISVPPKAYGGTELFIAHLTYGLHASGHRVTVYANGDSHVPGELKWRFRHSQWPIADACEAQLKGMDHAAWAVQDAARSVDILHINDAMAVPFTRFVDKPVVMTQHHPHEPALSKLYVRYPAIHYVSISEQQARAEPMPNIEVVHHGIPVAEYEFRTRKEDYLLFLGRMAPCKGPHLAIQVARRAGLRLKLAGEVQPFFRRYWEEDVLPGIDGDQIQYVGEADKATKNDLLSHARALLFPIQWNEPFGLVMIESMACGTPVLALPGGSVPEVVRDGVSGWICRDISEMARHAISLSIDAASCRAWVDTHFRCERMVDRYLSLYERLAHSRIVQRISMASRAPAHVSP
jgi:glycosyltransferase involved in cell wall biosynthesis